MNNPENLTRRFFRIAHSSDGTLIIFGPLWIPVRGAVVKLDTGNICLYERIIDVYEQNDLKVEGNVIYINGVPADSYQFKMNYYFMMGDNRHKSADSRYWGFVPEDHIIGKPKFVWLSTDKELSGFKKDPV